MRILLTVLTILGMFSCGFSEHTNSMKDGVTDSLKTGHLIQFSKADLKASPNAGFAQKFTLNQDSFLTLHFSLKQPLANSLKLLAPELSTEELLSNGNFQFKFLVDEKEIYVENLNTGAGLPKSKTEQLKHRIPLITPEQIDFWGWFMWLKFMMLGNGRDALDAGDHLLSIEVRPYLNHQGMQVGELLAQGSIDVHVSEIKVDKKLIALQPIQPNSGWPKSKEEFDIQKIEALNKKIAQKRFEDINGIVVIKNGELLIEEYFNGEDRNSLHDVRSVGKTFASTAMGIAINDQHISNEELQLKDFYDLKSFENYSPAKDQVTLKSLLTMSSGFLGDDSNYDSPGNEENMYPTKDWVKFTLDLPMNNEKVMGKDYAYFTAGVVVLGDIIHKSVPGGLVAYADKKLFAPLGIRDYKWEYTPQNVGNTAGGIRLRAIDFAKYGQLYKNRGSWNGKQILSKEWVDKSFTKHIKQGDQKDGYYGYLFWNKKYLINNKSYEVDFCTGRGGNKIFIFKDLPYVIVITASAYNSPLAHPNVDKMMEEYILPAIIE